MELVDAERGVELTVLAFEAEGWSPLPVPVCLHLDLHEGIELQGLGQEAASAVRLE